MKQSIIIVIVSVICIGATFWAGRLSGPDVPANNADGILAYQHYYECVEYILKDVTIKNADIAKEFALAKKNLEDYKNGHVMTWPEVCDQRDKLSDIIRKYADEENANIMNYVKDYFADPSVLKNWAYCY